MNPTAALPRAFAGVLGSAQVAAEPEDFFVEEQLGFAASEEGPHLLVQIEKRGLSTTEAMRLLAGHLGCAVRDMGYAGRKDRQALTRQWLSLPWPVNSALPGCGPVPGAREGQYLRIRSLQRHRRKLPVGSLRGNRFVLTLRALDAPRPAVNARLLAIAREGVPNYFGNQRFGREGDNLRRAEAWFAGEQRPRHRGDRSLLLSAARSACFNHLLGARVAAGNWATPLADDVLILDGRGSLFAADTASLPRLRARAAGLRLHPSAALPGLERKGLDLPMGLAAREAELLEPYALLVEGLRAQRVEAARRALRMGVGALGWYWLDAGTLRLAFTLPKGCYATALLRELIDWDAS